MREVKPIKKTDLGETVMPILGFWGPPDAYKSGDWNLPDLKTDQIYQWIKEAGFNTLLQGNDMWPKKKESVEKTLDLCEKHNLFYYVAVPELTRFKAYHAQDAEFSPATEQEIEEMITPFIGREGCIGLDIIDEPLPIALSEVGDFLKKYKNVLKKLGLTDKEYFINLLPVGSFVSRPPSIEGWQGYLQSYLDNVTKDYIGYDNYPFQTPGISKDNISPGLYNHLEGLIEVVDKNGGNIPMSFCAVTGGNWTEEEDNPGNRAPSPEELEWEVNTVLAFGVKRLIYFTLCNPHSYLKYMPHGQTGIFNPDGTKSRLYHAVRRCNEQVQAVDEYLLKAKNKQVIFVGDVPTRVEYRYKDHINDKDSSYMELVWVEGEGVIIGCFEYNGKSAFYVVNTYKKEQTVTLHFNGRKEMRLVKRNDGARKTVAQDLALKLGKGEATLVIVDNWLRL